LALLRITDMRTLVVLILLAAAGYYFYTRHGQVTTQQTGDVLPAEIAWRAVTRDDRAFVTQVEVVAVSGSRWRVEAKSPSKPNTVVVICDLPTRSMAPPFICGPILRHAFPTGFARPLSTQTLLTPSYQRHLRAIPAICFQCALSRLFYHVILQPND
jgi:hypothetical protein